ncbi:hypothetical protein GCK72_007847 [Caenorhabditis remanei]|uniref:Nucleolus and neural progenitor protein-like N-terminal domain-containing protein n=1 Tax=Caenorhabditis remanei TaxID=31234 RepID=A0A6A5HJ37_CAERE|nr:hypothetical protein GCK72_007847 [Caenorhabditis remanei]KAF1767888.1 hypothetical protein GCK72_007847 [Caenorhabditis remanei]
MNFALKSIISQLATPINLEAESMCGWLIYKQGGPQRHQKFFGFWRQMSRNVSKFNEMSLVKRLNSVLKKAENSGNSMYKIEASALKFVASEWLKRLFLLEKIAKGAKKCAENALGQLEIAQWINLSLVIFAVSAQIYSDVLKQTLEMERTWCPTISAIFRDIDERFPMKLSDLAVVKRMKLISENRKNLAGNCEIMRLLKFSTEKIEEAHVENELRQKT